MSAIDETRIVRDAMSVIGLLSDFGADVPSAVTAAREVYRDARRGAPSMPDRRTLGALALDKTPKAAAKEYTDGLAAQEVYAAIREVAALRLLRAVRSTSGEIEEAVLRTGLVRAAVSEIATVASTISPSVKAFPEPGTPEPIVIGAARLREAESTLLALAVRMETALGASLPTDRAALLWVDPADVEGISNFTALERALRAVRPGAIDAPIAVMGAGGQRVMDQTAHGIRSAIAAAVPGVRFAAVTNLAEFADRDARVTEGLRRERQDSSSVPRAARAVVWS